jgi:hypothetical protein
MGRPTGIEPVILVPQTSVITVSPWPPCFEIIWSHLSWTHLADLIAGFIPMNAERSFTLVETELSSVVRPVGLEPTT